MTELVDAYERIYQDHELATIATSVTLEQMMHDAAASRVLESEPTQRMRRMR